MRYLAEVDINLQRSLDCVGPVNVDVFRSTADPFVIGDQEQQLTALPGVVVVTVFVTVELICSD
jgi:ABC-type sulfate transport system permease subunit